MGSLTPTFMNYLRSIPAGCDTIPLKYVFHENDIPDPPAINDNFLDDYKANVPFEEGDSYAINLVQVPTFLMNFVTGNDTVEAKFQGLQRPNDGRKALKSDLLNTMRTWVSMQSIFARLMRSSRPCLTQEQSCPSIYGGLNLRRD